MRLQSDGEDSVARDPLCPKFQAVQRWVTRHLETVRHERQVVAIASSLFDVTRTLHGLPLSDRRLLRLGAMVHDVGRSVSKAEHPREGALMLQADRTLPLSPAERRAMAYLTLYHRGPVPPVGTDGILHPADHPGRLLRVLALLRGADALDSRSLEPVRLVFALLTKTTPTGHRTLRTTCYLTADCEKARKVYRRRKKFRLLEGLLGVEVEVEIDHAEGLRLVA